MALCLQAAHNTGSLFSPLCKSARESHCSACSLLHQWKKSSVKTATVCHDAMASNATVQLAMAVLTCVTGLPAGLTRSSAAALSAPNNAAPKEQSQADTVLFFAPIRQSVVASF